ncbi:endonuclease III domain-containing protein [Cupriavidus plantarum]|uniref:endonuclease III domain-containing protein n=1 Tax=Cupriavidus plantarum TaxID=942865 RepID=UPI0018546072|nr:endonuclease III domain-containing protein [Cupriavidus plantarum]NYH98495.1 DNA-3-methyladenine glycosylase II [Cupriavidus plantarum]
MNAAARKPTAPAKSAGRQAAQPTRSSVKTAEQAPAKVAPKVASKVAPKVTKVATKVAAPKVAPKVAAKVAPRAATKGARPSKPALPEAEGMPLPVETVVDAVRPAYWDEACADLMKRDRILRKMIPTYGPAHLISRGDPFVTLARSVVGQQISVKAAQAVWDRLAAMCPRLTPSQFLKAGNEQLASCGLSRRKAEYIIDLSEHFKAGRVHVNEWAAMEDEAVIAELTQIRGIGRWTAEMFLMFNLMRPNVLPLDDVGLINAISANYFSGEPVTRSEAREVAANWEPWRTVATWYMWRSLDPVPVTY